MINFTPVGKRFLIKQIKAPAASAGGILFTQIKNQEVHEGTVAAIGTGFTDGSDLTVGDRVLLTKWVKHDELNDDTGAYLVVDIDSVICKIVD